MCVLLGLDLHRMMPEEALDLSLDRNAIRGKVAKSSPLALWGLGVRGYIPGARACTVLVRAPKLYGVGSVARPHRHPRQGQAYPNGFRSHALNAIHWGAQPKKVARPQRHP